MLLPASGHRNAFLASIRNSYDTTFPNPAEGPALGLIASVAFVALMIWALLQYWKPSPTPRAAILGTLAALTWVSVICYTVGGVGELWSFLLNGGGLRAWSRMHVFIGLLALLAAGVALDAVRRRPLRWGLVAALTALAVVEQTSPAYRPDPVRATAMQTEVESLTGAIAASLPEDGEIYQYPDVSFAVALRDTAPASAYDGFLPYLYSSPDLSWSYGGLQGDPRADWQTLLGTRPMSQQAVLLEAAGFDGVLVDSAALTADPEALAAARTALGTPTVISQSGRWEYYALDGNDTACRSGADDLSDEALKPPILYPGDGFRPSGNVLINDAAAPSKLRVLTLRDGGWPHVDLWYTIDAPAGGLKLTWPDGRQEMLAAGTQEVHWSGTLSSMETDIGVERLDGATTPFLTYGFRTAVRSGADAERCLASLAGAS